MIDLKYEKLLTLREASQLLPRRRAGKPCHPATLYRWASSGIHGIKLESMRVGGSLCTSLEALQRFFERLSGESCQGRQPVRSSPTPHIDSQRSDQGSHGQRES